MLFHFPKIIRQCHESQTPSADTGFSLPGKRLRSPPKGLAHAVPRSVPSLPAERFKSQIEANAFQRVRHAKRLFGIGAHPAHRKDRKTSYPPKSAGRTSSRSVRCPAAVTQAHNLHPSLYNIPVLSYDLIPSISQRSVFIGVLALFHQFPFQRVLYLQKALQQNRVKRTAFPVQNHLNGSLMGKRLFIYPFAHQCIIYVCQRNHLCEMGISSPTSPSGYPFPSNRS